MTKSIPVDLDPTIRLHLEFCRVSNQRPNSIAARCYYLTRLQCDVGPLLTLTDRDLENWQLQHLSGHAVKSQLVAISHAQGFYKWAVRMRLLDRDPSVVLIRPRAPRMLPQPMPEDDLQFAIDSANPTVRVILILAGYCGLRACEIAGLTADAVHGRADPPYLEVREGKGGHQRIVPLPHAVYDELVVFGVRSDGARRAPVVPRQDGSGRPVSAAAISVAANSHLHKMGIPYSLHKARHRYGTRMYAISKDVLLVGSVMGHTDPKTTSGYIAFSQDDATDAASKVAAGLNASRRPSKRGLRVVA